MKLTLRGKLVLGFCISTLPLIVFLFYSNYYASNVIRGQVAYSSQSLLTLYGDQIDRTLVDGNAYLYNMATRDADIRSLVYTMNTGDEYVLAKQNVYNKLYNDFNYNKSLQVIFAYNPYNLDLIVLKKSEKSYEETTILNNFLFQQVVKENSNANYDRQWTVCRIGDERFLLRIVKTDTSTYVGALINMDDLMVPLELITTNRQTIAFFLASDGTLLTGSLPENDIVNEIKKAVLLEEGNYQTVQGQQKYLLVSHKLVLSDINLAVLLPEKFLLQRFPFFLRILYLIPVAGGGLLLFYLIFLQKVILEPIHYLIRGMRKIRDGDLNTRLSLERTQEFSLINETFNDMASQIQNLKIHVYEEDIRSHKTELKQLQLQINPHFLFNSINIMYNLAETKQYELIQEMARHLTSYFRSLTRTVGATMVTIRDEMEHVEHYLQIQKLRYPKHLNYELMVAESVSDCCLPPLVIQTFIENAIKHGFKMGKVVFCVTAKVVPISKEGVDFFEIIVEDNGRGFPRELVENMDEILTKKSFYDAHIGIWNVVHRLQLQYQGASELFLENQETGGARIRILVPLQRMDRKVEEEHV